MVLARFTNVEGNTPTITLNRFGKGRALPPFGVDLLEK